MIINFKIIIIIMVFYKKFKLKAVSGFKFKIVILRVRVIINVSFIVKVLITVKDIK